MIAESSSFTRILRAGYHSRAAAVHRRGQTILSAGICWNASTRSHHILGSVTGCNHSSSTEQLDLAFTICYVQPLLCHFLLGKKRPTQSPWKVNGHNDISENIQERAVDAKKGPSAVNTWPLTLIYMYQFHSLWHAIRFQWSQGQLSTATKMLITPLCFTSGGQDAKVSRC